MLYTTLRARRRRVVSNDGVKGVVLMVSWYSRRCVCLDVNSGRIEKWKRVRNVFGFFPWFGCMVTNYFSNIRVVVVIIPWLHGYVGVRFCIICFRSIQCIVVGEGAWPMSGHPGGLRLQGTRHGWLGGAGGRVVYEVDLHWGDPTFKTCLVSNFDLNHERLMTLPMRPERPSSSLTNGISPRYHQITRDITKSPMYYSHTVQVMVAMRSWN